MSVKLLTEHYFGVSKVKRRLHRFVLVYAFQNATLLEITCRGSYLNISSTTLSLTYSAEPPVQHLTFYLWISFFLISISDRILTNTSECILKGNA